MKLGQNFVKYFVHFLGNGVSRKIGAVFSEDLLTFWSKMPNVHERSLKWFIVRLYSWQPQPIFGRQGRHSDAAAANFYSAISIQGLGLGGLASRGGPVVLYRSHKTSGTII